MVEIDSTIMERVVLTGTPGTDIEAVYDRKRCVLFTSATIDRAVSLLKSRWEAAQKFTWENPDEHGELPFLDAIQDHWDASGLDRAMEEAETLLVRLLFLQYKISRRQAVVLSMCDFVRMNSSGRIITGKS
ncbi:hypothetical protein Aduo_015312 [Ancylostoma duodenale]